MHIQTTLCPLTLTTLEPATPTSFLNMYTNSKQTNLIYNRTNSCGFSIDSFKICSALLFLSSFSLLSLNREVILSIPSFQRLTDVPEDFFANPKLKLYSGPCVQKNLLCTLFGITSCAFHCFDSWSEHCQH